MKTFFALLSLSLCLTARADVSASSLLSIEEYRATNGDTSLFIRPVTNFDKSYIELDATSNGAAATLEHPTRDLWIYKVPNAGPHTVYFTISLEDARRADRLNESLSAANLSIVDLRAQISQTTDPQRIAALQAELNKKLDLKILLESELRALKNPIGHEAYSFQSFNSSISSVN